MGVSRIFHVTLITYLIVHVGATCDQDYYPKCPLEDEYFHCQEDITNEYSRIAFCAKRVQCGAGNHAVLDNATKTVTCEECTRDMYQPEEKWSNIFTQPNCDYRVSLCNEQQVVCENATSTQNNKCACNHTAGYKPDDTTACKCFSQDSSDCGCVKANCKEEEVLTEDFICTSSSSSGTTTPISTSAPPNSSGYVLAIALPLVLIIALCLVAIVVYCCYKRKKRKRKSETLGGESAPLNTRPTTGIDSYMTKKEKTDSKTDGDGGDISAESVPLTPNSQAIVTELEETDRKTLGERDNVSHNTETSKEDVHEGNNHNQKSKGEHHTKTSGTEAGGDVHARDISAVHSLTGGMNNHNVNSVWGLTICSCCNNKHASPSNEPNGQPTKGGKEKDNIERLEQQATTINVRGVEGGTVRTANTAGVVKGGMGNKYNSGGNDLETDGCDDEPNNARAPLASSEYP